MPIALVVVAEAEPRARLAAYVRRVRGISVIAASSLEEAQIAAQIDPPDLLVVDWSLPDGGAAEVIASVGSLRDPCILIVLEENEPEPSDPVVARCVHILRQPVSSRGIRKVLERVTRETLDRQPLLGPAEYLQLACMGGHTAVVQCSHEGVAMGEIFVREGEIWAALDGEGAGVEAFRRLVQSDALARLKTTDETPKRNVEGNWQYLLLEAARREDEKSAEYTLDPIALEESESARQVDEELRAAARCVLRRDLQAAAEHFAAAAALRPDDALIRHNVERLRSDGFQPDTEGS